MGWLQYIKDEFKEGAHVYRALVFFLFITVITGFILKSPKVFLSALAGMMAFMAFKKSGFGLIVAFLAWSDDKKVLTTCGKRLADWLEKLSVAAIIPFLLLGVTVPNFIEEKPAAVSTAALIVIIAGFCSIRFSKFLAEGIFDDPAPSTPPKVDVRTHSGRGRLYPRAGRHRASPRKKRL